MSTSYAAIEHRGGVVALAGAIGSLAFSSDCDGKIIRNAWRCVRHAGFDPAFCNGLYEAQETRISRAPANFCDGIRLPEPVRQLREEPPVELVGEANGLLRRARERRRHRPVFSGDLTRG